MHVHIKAAAAILLIGGSLGVIAYDMRYLKSGEQKKESLFGENHSALAEGAAGFPWGNTAAVAEGPAAQAGEVPEPLAPLPMPGQEGNGETTAAEPANWEEAPLGQAWEGTLWSELITSYVNRSRAEGGQASPEPVDSVVIDPAQENSLSRILARQSDSEQTVPKDLLDQVQVKAILRGGKTSSALVNGWILHPGDFVPGIDARVAEIGRDYLLLDWANCDELVLKRIEPFGVKAAPAEAASTENPASEAEAPSAAAGGAMP